MKNYYERLRFIRTIARGSEAYTHIAWLIRVEQHQHTKEQLQ